MQTAQFLSTPITADNAKGRTFYASVSILEQLGWDFADWNDLDENGWVSIDVDVDGSTYYLPNDYSKSHRVETGDDAQTIKDLETLRVARQLEMGNA